MNGNKNSVTNPRSHITVANIIWTAYLKVGGHFRQISGTRCKLPDLDKMVAVYTLCSGIYVWTIVSAYPWAMQYVDFLFLFITRAAESLALIKTLFAVQAKMFSVPG